MLECLDEFIEKYSVRKEDICVVGSAALEIAGIRKARDIDIIMRSEVREKLFSKADSEELCQLNKKVEISRRNHYGAFMKLTDDEIIGNEKYYDCYNGYKTINLDILKSKKMNLMRGKDIHDLIKMGVPLVAIFAALFRKITRKIVMKLIPITPPPM